MCGWITPVLAHRGDIVALQSYPIAILLVFIWTTSSLSGCKEDTRGHQMGAVSLRRDHTMALYTPKRPSRDAPKVSPGTLRSRSLRSGTLWSRSLRSGTLRSRSLRSGTLRSRSLRSGTLRSRSLRSGTLWSRSLRSGTLWSRSLRSGTLWSRSLRSGTLWSRSLRS